MSKFKEYFDELYGQGLQVANWHENGDLEPLDNFIDSALDEETNHKTLQRVLIGRKKRSNQLLRKW